MNAMDIDYVKGTTIYDLPGHILVYILWLCDIYEGIEPEDLGMVNKDWYSIITKFRMSLYLWEADELFNRMSFRYYLGMKLMLEETYLSKCIDHNREIHDFSWDIYGEDITISQRRHTASMSMTSNVFKYRALYIIGRRLYLESNGNCLFGMRDYPLFSGDPLIHLNRHICTDINTLGKNGKYTKWSNYQIGIYRLKYV